MELFLRVLEPILVLALLASVLILGEGDSTVVIAIVLFLLSLTYIAAFPWWTRKKNLTYSTNQVLMSSAAALCMAGMLFNFWFLIISGRFEWLFLIPGVLCFVVIAGLVFMAVGIQHRSARNWMQLMYRATSLWLIIGIWLLITTL